MAVATRSSTMVKPRPSEPYDDCFNLGISTIRSQVALRTQALYHRNTTNFTVYKNLAFGLDERNEKNINEKVSKMLDFFGLQEYAKKYPHQLSGGQKQLVAISRSLVLKPRVLLMDEPLANLDVKLKRKMLDHIKNLKHNFDLTIIYVTHDHKEAFEIADNIVVLNEGEIEGTGTVEHIKNSEIFPLITIYRIFTQLRRFLIHSIEMTFVICLKYCNFMFINNFSTTHYEIYIFCRLCLF